MKNIKKCFLVDDDIDDQEIFKMALEEIEDSTSLAVAISGTEALKKLSDEMSFVPDYIFLDVNMPKMNGIQCLSEIRKLEHLKDTKIIMFSTSSKQDIIDTSKELGADDYLVKPAKLAVLVENLTKILEK